MIVQLLHALIAVKNKQSAVDAMISTTFFVAKNVAMITMITI